MLLDIVVIVLRETLEASILVGVLLFVSRSADMGFSWLWKAVLIGALGALLYALNLGVISELFDDVGQEVVNALMQYIVYAALVLIIGVQFVYSAPLASTFKTLMIVAVAVAITREVGELFVFYSGFLSSEDRLLSAATSGFIGLAVGMSAGAIVYYSLVGQAHRRSLVLHTTVLSLVAGGMVMQATQLLIQADWLTANQPLWDTNRLLPEASVAGQIIYAVFGYEATPSKQEVTAYTLSILLILVVALIANWRSTNNNVFIAKS